MRARGCRLRHRGPKASPARQAVNTALSLAEPTPLLGRSRAALTDEQFEEYPYRIASEVLLPLSNAFGLEAKTIPDGDQRLLTARNLLDEMNAPDNSMGFTLSDRFGPGSAIGVPEKGHCVTLPGSHLALPLGAAYDSTTGEPSEEALQEVEAWLEHLRPALDDSTAWIGGFKWEDEPHAGRFEINVTLVFPLDQEKAAAEAASVWRQNSYYTIDPNNGKRLTKTYGDGGRSVYEPKGRLRNWWEQRKAMEEGVP